MSTDVDLGRGSGSETVRGTYLRKFLEASAGSRATSRPAALSELTDTVHGHGHRANAISATLYCPRAVISFRNLLPSRKRPDFVAA